MDRQLEKSEIRRIKLRRYIKWGIAGAVIVAGAAALLSSVAKSVPQNDLVIVTVDHGDLEATAAAAGYATPAYEEIVNAPVSTRILDVFAQPGDSVRAGMPLLQLDLEDEQVNYEKLTDTYNISCQELTKLQLAARNRLSELEMQIKVKDMELSRLRIDVENERRLDSLGSGTGERVRQAETACRTAELELAHLRSCLANERENARATEVVQQLNVSSIKKDLDLKAGTLRRGRIPAPADGILTYIISEIGSQVSTGTKVAVVANLSQFKLKGEIAEGSASRIAIGSDVTARIGRDELTGRITNISPQAVNGLISFTVDLDDPSNARLRPGLRVDLAVNYGFKDDVVRLPSGAFFKGAGEYDIFVLDGDDRLVRRRVKLGDSNRRYIEVVSGLAAGDRVVVSDMEKYIKSTELKIKN